jgi:3-methyladenine DNA glycosylase Tag
MQEYCVSCKYHYYAKNEYGNIVIHCNNEYGCEYVEESGSCDYWERMEDKVDKLIDQYESLMELIEDFKQSKKENEELKKANDLLYFGLTSAYSLLLSKGLITEGFAKKQLEIYAEYLKK